MEILKWFRKFNVISGLDDHRYYSFTYNKLKGDENFRKIVIDFIKIADLGIENIVFKESKETKEILDSIAEDFKEFLQNKIKSN